MTNEERPIIYICMLMFISAISYREQVRFDNAIMKYKSSYVSKNILQCALCFLTMQCCPMSPRIGLFVCLFVLGVYCPTREFFTYIETSTSLLPVKGCEFKPMLGTNSYWAVRVLWRAPPTVKGVSVYNCHLRGPVTLTLVEERLAMELSLPVFTTYVCRGWDSNNQPSACKANALTHCTTAAIVFFVLKNTLIAG